MPEREDLAPGLRAAIVDGSPPHNYSTKQRLLSGYLRDRPRLQVPAAGWNTSPGWKGEASRNFFQFFHPPGFGDYGKGMNFSVALTTFRICNTLNSSSKFWISASCWFLIISNANLGAGIKITSCRADKRDVIGGVKTSRNYNTQASLLPPTLKDYVLSDL